jgi:DNA-binding MarR family transcriptional regulator
VVDQAVPVVCNSLALRQAARHVSQAYDAALAPLGLRTTQYSILIRLERSGPWSLGALAAKLVLDRTTLGRTIRPLIRDGLATMQADPADRRSRVLAITAKGSALVARATPAWESAQARFDAVYGADKAARLRRELAQVASAPL